MNTQCAINLARKHAFANQAQDASSAYLCLADAIAQSNAGDLANAKARAIKSLAYSVGVFHPDYKRASA
jgi:hypothetical protein